MSGERRAHEVLRSVPPALLFAGAVVGAGLGALGAGGRHVVTAFVVGAVVGAVGVIVGTIDVRERRIPNVFVLATLLAALAIAFVVLAAEGRSAFAAAGAGALLAGVPLLVVHLVSPRGLGFGDVKYGATLGALLGVVDWRAAVVAVMVASLTGGLVGLVYAPWRRSIPFGLFLSIGAAVALAVAGLTRPA